MAENTEALGWLRLARTHWHEPIGLLAALIFTLALSLGIATLASQLVAVAIFLPSCAVLFVTWLSNRRLPRCPRNRIGFVTVFKCENSQIREQFKNDFVQNLNVLLSNGKSTFWFKDFSDRKDISVVTREDANQLQLKARAHFVLYGTVRTRGRKEEKKHFVDISGLVWHGPIDKHNKSLLEKEFSELLLRRVEVNDNVSLPAFELTSALAETASRYVIAVALECSGSWDQADIMFEELQLRVRDTSLASHPTVRKIAERIPARKMELSVARANLLHKEWLQSRDNELLEQIDQILEQVENPQRYHGQWKILKAIVEVLLRQNVKEAEKLIRSCPSTDPITLMNLAFISACKRDLRAVVKHYRAAKKSGVTLETIAEVMDFIEWQRAVKNCPYAEFTFCLGFIACELEGDYLLAKSYFDEFVATATDNRYADQRNLIPKWLRQIPGES